MNIEDHLPPDPPEIDSFQQQLTIALESGDLAEASRMLTSGMLDFFATYREEPLLFGLLRIANAVIVEDCAGTNVIFNTKRKVMHVPVEVARRIANMHDLACLLLVERSRLVVLRSTHCTFADMYKDFDFTQRSHRYVFDMALSCWSIALARCYCASILPERLYAMYADLQHNVMHGVAPDMFAAALKTRFPNIAKVYLELYNMGGQEQYHFMLNRVASDSTITLPFIHVFDHFWKDLSKDAPSNEDLENKEAARLAQNHESDGEESGPADKQEEIKASNSKHGNGNGFGGFGSMHAVPVVDIDVDSELDQYLAEFFRIVIKKDSFHSSMHGAERNVADLDRIRTVFKGLGHGIMLEAENQEDALYYGDIAIPQHPTSRDLSMHVQGYTPALWETQMMQTTNKVQSRYAAYYDVSGSMFAWFQVVRPFLHTLGPVLDSNALYGFSTDVRKIDMDACHIMTTGGTKIDCALKHARTHGITHLILISDLEDWSNQPLDTEGLEHIVIICTDKTTALKDTVFRNPHPTTKLDYMTLRLKDVVRDAPKRMPSFNKKTIASALGSSTCEITAQANVPKDEYIETDEPDDAGEDDDY